MADPISRDDIKARLENVEKCLKRQEKELESWRERSVRVPNWIRNGGIALFMALFMAGHGIQLQGTLRLLVR